MKKLLLIALAFIVSIAVFHSCNEPVTEIINGEELELKSADSGVKSYVVVLNDDELNTELTKLKGYEKKQEAMKSASAKILKRAGISDAEVEHVYGTALKGFSVKIAPGQLKKLQDDPVVKYIEEDQVVSLIEPNAKPSGKPGGGGGGSTSQTVPWGITRVSGGLNSTGTAWIIDSGIDLNHPDLNVDVARSRTFLGGNSTPDDQHGHGTHVSGTIAAKNNSIGVIGVAAGASVVAVRVLDRRGSGYTSGVIAGVDYVAGIASRGDVANMSLGGGVSTTLDNAVITAAASCSFILAAGNESDDADNHSPARAEGSNIYTISAMDVNDNWAYFSNYGSHVDWCAPGYSILSTYKDGGYATMSGTSMAAPHIAGVLLLGPITKDGTVKGDPDGTPDNIGIHVW